MLRCTYVIQGAAINGVQVYASHVQTYLRLPLTFEGNEAELLPDSFLELLVAVLEDVGLEGLV